jgi:hypothetical protein
MLAVQPRHPPGDSWGKGEAGARSDGRSSIGGQVAEVETTISPGRGLAHQGHNDVN